jgi:hypothetical protein
MYVYMNTYTHTYDIRDAAARSLLRFEEVCAFAVYVHICVCVYIYMHVSWLSGYEN